MKKLNRKFIKGTNWALAGLLSFLGFSSCEPTEEYGSPYAEYVVSGKVTDAEGKGLQGITVKVPNVVRAISYPAVTDTIRTVEVVTTNKSGDFKYTYRDGSLSDTLKVKVKVDNNSYEPDSTMVVFTKSELSGGKNWSHGKAEKKIDIKLKRK